MDQWVLCEPTKPMAGTSATIFEWEDSGNGFLRGGHRSLRFPSDTLSRFTSSCLQQHMVRFLHFLASVFPSRLAVSCSIYGTSPLSLRKSRDYFLCILTYLLVISLIPVVIFWNFLKIFFGIYCQTF